MAAKRGLGRGLKALMTEVPALDETPGGRSGSQKIPIENIVKSPFQPRQTFGQHPEPAEHDDFEP